MGPTGSTSGKTDLLREHNAAFSGIMLSVCLWNRDFCGRSIVKSCPVRVGFLININGVPLSEALWKGLPLKAAVEKVAVYPGKRPDIS